MRETWVQFLGLKIPWRRDRLPTPVLLDFPCGSASKESTYNVGDLGLTPGLGRSPGKGKDYPFQYSGLENSMQSMGLQSQTQLRDLQFTSHRDSLVAQRVKRLPPMWETWVRFLGRDDPLEKEMAAHSSIFLIFFFCWTPVFLPGKSHGQRSLVDYCPWGRKELDTT